MTDDAARAMACAESLAAACERLLGHLLVTVLLHGSLTLRDYVPGRSDVDLLVVVERPLTDAELEALRDIILIHAEETPRRIDIRVVTRSVASAPVPSPAMELYVGSHGQGEPEIQTRVQAEPDLVVEFAMARAKGRNLRGGRPQAAIGAVPEEWVVAYGDKLLARWEGLTEDAAHAELMVLTACRIWRLALEGAYGSKTAAGRWALARDQRLTAVERALRLRSGASNVLIEPSDIAHLLTVVRGDVRRRLVAAHREAIW